MLFPKKCIVKSFAEQTSNYFNKTQTHPIICYLDSAKTQLRQKINLSFNVCNGTQVGPKDPKTSPKGVNFKGDKMEKKISHRFLKPIVFAILENL